MIKWIKSKLYWNSNLHNEDDYEDCISEILKDEHVVSMRKFLQHGDTNTLEHSLNVSYYSYKMCKRLGLDYRSAARGGLLHDFFLYDWHGDIPYKGLHGYHHPKVALHNAEKRFQLNHKERDIIKKHMWPLTISLPRYKEAFIVLLMDKYCTMAEVMSLRQRSTNGLKIVLGIN